MKKNKSFYNRTIKPFIKDNRVLLTALAGAATGIVVTGMVRTGKAKDLLEALKGMSRIRQISL